MSQEEQKQEQKQEQEQEQELNLLDELASAENEFDVDLMACGCRLAPATDIQLATEDLIRLMDFTEDQLAGFVDALIREGKFDDKQVWKLADEASRGELKATRSVYRTRR